MDFGVHRGSWNQHLSDTEGWVILNVYAPNNRSIKYVKEKLIEPNW